jgi:hypothetical protein
VIIRPDPAASPYRRIAVRSRAVRHFLDQIPWPLAILAALTLGLAPFRPPHVVEKVEMLFKGTLVKPIDWFDLVLHGTPWLVAILKGAFALKR